jgi:hypothetical protein
MPYIVFISAMSNKSGRRFIYGPGQVDGRYSNIKYWMLPPHTTDKNVHKVISELIEELFHAGKEVKTGPFQPKQQIKNYDWDGKIKPTGMRTQRQRIDKDPDAKFYRTNVFYYVEKVDATPDEKFKTNCDYHRKMIKHMTRGGGRRLMGASKTRKNKRIHTKQIRNGRYTRRR